MRGCCEDLEKRWPLFACMFRFENGTIVVCRDDSGIEEATIDACNQGVSQSCHSVIQKRSVTDSLKLSTPRSPGFQRNRGETVQVMLLITSQILTVGFTDLSVWCA